jgi:hypothetical protein
MTTAPEEPVDVADMLRTMDARIHACEAASQRSLSSLAQARDLLWRFRAEPLGGRLVGLKRLVYWFSASAFDRQAKVQEAMLNALDEIARELVDLRNRMAILRMDLEQNAGSGGAGRKVGNGRA